LIYSRSTENSCEVIDIAMWNTNNTTDQVRETDFKRAMEEQNIKYRLLESITPAFDMDTLAIHKGKAVDLSLDSSGHIIRSWELARDILACVYRKEARALAKSESEINGERFQQYLNEGWKIGFQPEITHIKVSSIDSHVTVTRTFEVKDRRISKSDFAVRDRILTVKLFTDQTGDTKRNYTVSYKLHFKCNDGNGSVIFEGDHRDCSNLTSINDVITKMNLELVPSGSFMIKHYDEEMKCNNHTDLMKVLDTH